MLCSILLGSLWRLNDFYAWMSMRSIRVNAANSILEERYWDVFPAKCLRFWPLFLRKSKDIAAFLERTNPVLVETRMTGIGSFVAEIKFLSPRVTVEWNGQVWCISHEGRMWNLADKSIGFAELKIPRKPLWRMPASSVISIVSGDKLENNLENLNGSERLLPSGVFPSVFSIDLINDFLKGLGNASWFSGIEEVILDRMAGDDLFKLRYIRNGQSFTILILKGKYGWQEINLALEHVLDGLRLESGDWLIDVTYKDKIVVKSLSTSTTGAAEGSSK